jgi:ADP-ribose pyrophosphatase YjhB (NUDIX family)
MNSHFASGVIFAFYPQEKKWYILGATVKGFPMIRVKIPGGTNNEFPKETPLETLKREVKEEMELEVINSTVVHSYNVSGKISGDIHTRYFYLVTKFSGKFPIKYVHDFDDDGDAVSVKWWTVEDMDTFIFQNHKDGFEKAFLEMSEICPDFKAHNMGLYEKYSKVKV